MTEQFKQTQAQQREHQRMLEACQMRDREIDILYEKLFEEKILSNLTEERFKKLSEKYELEQAELKMKIIELTKIVSEERNHEMSTTSFFKSVREYTEIATLLPEHLSTFIDKIVVHHREKIDGELIQKVEIHYKMVGYINLPYSHQENHNSTKPEKEENNFRTFEKNKKTTKTKSA